MTEAIQGSAAFPFSVTVGLLAFALLLVGCGAGERDGLSEEPLVIPVTTADYEARIKLSGRQLLEDVQLPDDVALGPVTLLPEGGIVIGDVEAGSVFFIAEEGVVSQPVRFGLGVDEMHSIKAIDVVSDRIYVYGYAGVGALTKLVELDMRGNFLRSDKVSARPATDIAFAGHGLVSAAAVLPRSQVENLGMNAYRALGDDDLAVRIYADAYGNEEMYRFHSRFNTMVQTPASAHIFTGLFLLDTDRGRVWVANKQYNYLYAYDYEGTPLLRLHFNDSRYPRKDYSTEEGTHTYGYHRAIAVDEHGLVFLSKGGSPLPEDRGQFNFYRVDVVSRTGELLAIMEVDDRAHFIDAMDGTLVATTYGGDSVLAYDYSPYIEEWLSRSE
ncbi:MAG: hypothetical protein ACOC8L_05295 [Spirochaetota bacterium]